MTRIDMDIPLKAGEVLDEPSSVALTVHLPEPGTLLERPVVCFAKPGGGYSKGYYTEELSTTPAPPGQPAIVGPWIPRDASLTDHPVVLNQAAVERSRAARSGRESGDDMGWGFHYDDIDPDIVRRDLAHFRRGIHNPAAQAGHTGEPWSSLTTPGAVARKCTAPRAVAQEAAVVTVPVLTAFGERDVATVPKLEPTAYQCADSVDMFTCPRMAHMHNFAGTRELLWQRIEQFGGWVRIAAGLV